MLNSLTKVSAIVALSVLWQPLAAQETSEGEAPVAGGLDMGQTVLGQLYMKEKSGDWLVVCTKTNADADPCHLSQTLNDAGGPVAEINLYRLEEGNQAVAGAQLLAPLGTLLTTGVSFSVDGAPGKRYNFSHCEPGGCIAKIGLTDGDIAAFKQGTAATVSLRPAEAPAQIVKVPMSLKGFTAGFDGLKPVLPN
ncbi:Invasion protein B, involved in pathogenesis [Tritonibacter multivorans]|uniref:Invasion protein B, involved in pathogenesis n=1 Tax=Tritonibacter multivorans TaxID=928856 RepID=A0A0N7M160_9RHOB|nr:invasion associated locus B family protein [Tritonibacter multivorans]MDA7421458.1 invasion associated locus B family protein [Tritonibacter multivorans]CUH82361.1 Invasion protein B, involved in pathogenesis [Tritonibacter multivorans]SFC99264.1 Invasion protein IalB, involved in pathogenesis [Tritonibacter multivorans]